MKTTHSKFSCCVAAVLVFALALCPTAFAKAVPNHTTEFYVNDFADVLSQETENEIQTHAVSLANETTAQVCVLTIDSLDGEDISEYSVEVFREWGIGNAQTNNGVLILLSVDDREMWITTGYGVEGTLTDTRLGQMRDIYAIPYYSNDDFDTGTRLLFGAIVNELRTVEYGLEPDGDLVYYQSNNMYEVDGNSDSEGIYAFLLVWSLVLLLPVISWIYTSIRYLLLKRYDKKHGTNRAEDYKKKVSEKKARYSTNHRSGHYHGSGGFRGGGGFGSGGGGFRGGGGSTGGGGAGGRF